MAYSHEFTWTGEGGNVVATGSFDGWSSSLPLLKNEQGTHSAFADVPYGTKVFYKYVVDGNWQHNPHEAHETDESGNINNVFTTPEAPVVIPVVPVAEPPVAETPAVIPEPEVVPVVEESSAIAPAVEVKKAVEPLVVPTPVETPIAPAAETSAPAVETAPAKESATPVLELVSGIGALLAGAAVVGETVLSHTKDVGGSVLAAGKGAGESVVAAGKDALTYAEETIASVNGTTANEDVPVATEEVPSATTTEAPVVAPAALKAQVVEEIKKEVPVVPSAPVVVETPAPKIPEPVVETSAPVDEEPVVVTKADVPSTLSSAASPIVLEKAAPAVPVAPAPVAPTPAPVSTPPASIATPPVTPSKDSTIGKKAGQSSLGRKPDSVVSSDAESSPRPRKSSFFHRLKATLSSPKNLVHIAIALPIVLSSLYMFFYPPSSST